MKRVFIYKVILVVILLTLALLPLACSSAQLGETAAEGRRRHQRILRVNQSELMSDIDKVLLFDQPSTLTDMRIP